MIQTNFIRRRPKVRRWVLISSFCFLASGLLCIGFLWLVLKAEFLQVSRLDIPSGIQGELTADLIKTSFVRKWLGPGSLLFWSEKDVMERARLFPVTASLKLTKDWQARTIKIVAEEKERQGIYCVVKESECFWFDSQGMLFGQAPVTSGYLIVKIDDQNERFAKPGEYILSDSEARKNLFSLIEILGSSGTLETKRFSISDISLQEFEVRTDGPLLLFSSRFVPKDLGQTLSRLSEETGNFRNIGYIDFRTENRVYYK